MRPPGRSKTHVDPCSRGILSIIRNPSLALRFFDF
jgi:hypothetical protein